MQKTANGVCHNVWVIMVGETLVETLNQVSLICG